MIIWINGTFGVGKTTTSEIVADTTEWRTFDPEHVGYMLAANLRDQQISDFQDLAPWRSLVPTVAEELFRFTGQPLIAVQTVLVDGGSRPTNSSTKPASGDSITSPSLTSRGHG